MLNRRVVLMFTCLAGLLAGQGAADEEQIWKDFIGWVKTESLSDPRQVFPRYRAKLAAAGAAEEQIARQMSVLQKFAGTRTDLMALNFDKIYASGAPPFSTDPSAFLVEAVRDLKPGRALDVAMGQGRNSVFLAQKGWDVTGFDISEGGLAAAQAGAAKAGVKINTVRQSFDEFDFGKQQWDLIVLTYSLISLSNPANVRKLRDALKPGGIVVVEQFNANPAAPGSKGPANALFKSFEEFRVLHYEDKEGTSEWGKAKARLGRIVAQYP